MITCHRSNLEARCIERGYALDEVMSCVVSQDGDMWTIDVDHAAFPRTSRVPQQPQPPAAIGSGPGTELKKLLARIGITSAPDCSCNRVAAEMDLWGPDESEKPERIEYVLAAMRQNAANRGLPFVDIAGRILIRKAIKNARKLGNLAR